MKCAICRSVAVVVVATVVTSAYSQVQRPRVRAGRQDSRPAAGQSSGTQSVQGQAGSVDPNMTPQQQMAQQQREFQQRMIEMQRQIAEMQRQAEESRSNAIRQMLNATDEQWPRIRPKLDLIEQLKTEATVSADPGSSSGMSSFQSGGTSFGGGAMGGWMSGGMMDSSGKTQTWSSSSNGRSSAERTDGEVLCEQLLRDLQSPGTPPAEITQRIAALRKIRTQAREQLAQARKDLRTLIVPAQEPALVALGYLD